MNAAYGLPIFGMGQEHPCPDDILEAGASLGKRNGGQFKDAACLAGDIQIVGAGWAGSREVNNIADSNGAGEADDWLVGRGTTDILTHGFLNDHR